jgi:serine/threonine-protein kinase
MTEWIGRYRILRPLGEGGMGRTFLGEAAGARGFSRRVVIKVVKDELDPGLERSLLAEARLVASLVHRNIVPVLDLEEADERRLVVMEHVDGMDLRRLIERRGRLPWPLAVFVASEVAAGLDYAHRKTDAAGRPLSIVHRDVSPANVLLSWEGEVKLTDFGVAKFARSGESWVGAIKGNPGYMAPEQARGEPIDARADLFALGVALAEMVRGEPQSPSPPSSASDDPPPALLQVIARATEPEAPRRYPTAAAMREALLAIPGQPQDPARALAAFVAGARDERRLAPDALYDAVLGGGRPMTQVKPADTVADPPPTGQRVRRRAVAVVALALASAASLAAALTWWIARSPAPVATKKSAPAINSAVASNSPPAPAINSAVASNSPPAPPVPPAPVEKPRPRPGALSVNSIPWANLFLDGRALGHTPRANLSLEPGRHRLRLVTRGGDVRQRIVDIAPGKQTVLTVDFAKP